MPFVNSVPTMTSNTAPSGVCSASTEAYASAYKAFDGSGTLANSWSARTLPCWIQYKFDTAEACSGYTIEVYDSGYAPKTWTMEASNTGSFGGEEVTLDTQTNITSWTSGTAKTFTFTNTTDYLYYRVNVTATNNSDFGGTHTWFSILEIGDNIVIGGEATVSVSAWHGELAKGDVAITASGDGSIKEFDHLFTFLQPIQTTRVIKDFRFVQVIEQEKSSTIIKRVNT